MAPKVDFAEALAALTAQMQDLKTSLETKLENNSSSITDLQVQFARLEKKPPPPSLPSSTPITSSSPSSSLDTTGSALTSAIHNTNLKTPRFYLNYFDALTWFQWMFNNHQLYDWSTFTRSLELRFSASGYLQPQVALFKLRQTSTVSRYQREFEILANRVVGLTQEHLMNLFVSGLKPEIQREVIMFHPLTHYQAFELALMVEAKLPEGRGAYHRQPSQAPFSPSLPSLPPRQPMALPAPPRPSLALPAPPSQPTIKRLTPSEMQARRAKGLCYNCDDQYKLGHRCRTAPFLLLQTEDESIIQSPDSTTFQTTGPLSLAELPLPPSPLDESEFQVSFNALYGSSSPNTLKLFAEIHGERFTVLIDSGSTHNLIQPRIARFLSLAIEPAPSFAVMVGNGETLQCEGRVSDLSVTLQSHSFQLDLFLLDISGADLVLGIQCTYQAISGPVFSFLDQLRKYYKSDPQGHALCEAILTSPASHPDFSVHDGLVMRLGRIVIPDGHPLQQKLLQEYHCTLTGGHAAMKKINAAARLRMAAYGKAELSKKWSKSEEGFLPDNKAIRGQVSRHLARSSPHHSTTPARRQKLLERIAGQEETESVKGGRDKNEKES
ncbi:Retrotransposon gag protein [Corchorus olitorius]|uniref:Retrotransposon gag protein n=1 Tax=Corchorus olitorius TaxID=93759 RepID=A0A1R3HIA4_9ROSI|nr:Retrotransposon gag protein [Corchorus olitorius]